LANPIEEQPTSIVALPYWYGSNTYAFPKGAPMMSINTNHVLTQPMWYLMHYPSMTCGMVWMQFSITIIPIIAPIHVTT